MAALTVGVIKETAPREHRVALDPDGVSRLIAAGCDVIVEAGAGSAAWFPDPAYSDAGAKIVPTTEIFASAAVVLSVRPPSPTTIAAMRSG
jgi:NAD(P) transhydrogenase subunit alpha